MALRYKNIKNKSEIYDIFTIDTPPDQTEDHFGELEH